MRLQLLSHIDATKRGNCFGFSLAVNGQTLCLLECSDLRACAAEVVLVLRVETAEAVYLEELFELEDVVALRLETLRSVSAT